MPLTTLGEENANDCLLIFEEFRVDRTLPKYQEKKEQEATVVGSGVTYNMTPGTFVINERAASFTPKEPGWWSRFWKWFTFRSPKSVKYVFDAVLTNKEELEIFDERSAASQKLMEDAERLGQKSFKKQLEKAMEVAKFENALVAVGMKRFVSEEQLLHFVSNCERGLCLDWIRRFTRVIPEDVAEQKLKCDERHLFDNYVVLHYDPDNKGTSERDRKKQQEKRKDPILFGVIRGSRRLYFVGDWIDEYCDLTLQQLVSKLGADGEKKTTLDSGSSSA